MARHTLYVRSANPFLTGLSIYCAQCIVAGAVWLLLPSFMVAEVDIFGLLKFYSDLLNFYSNLSMDLRGCSVEKKQSCVKPVSVWETTWFGTCFLKVWKKFLRGEFFYWCFFTKILYFLLKFTQIWVIFHKNTIIWREYALYECWFTSRRRVRVVSQEFGWWRQVHPIGVLGRAPILPPSEITQIWVKFE